jgi:glycoprotein endo-alpha-1,2-mannosidase
MIFRSAFITLLAWGIFSNCRAQERAVPDSNLFVFYYNWYGNPANDGKYCHWSHPVLPHWSDTTWNHRPSFPGGEDIGANYYPQLGCYSCNDTSIINKHMQMIAGAGIGVLVITWWGKDSYEDRSVRLYLDAASKHGLKIAFHIEPFYKTINEFKEAVCYIIDTYGKHPAFYRTEEKPMFYIYDSYKLDVREWASLFSKETPNTLRKTKYDGIFIGLWVNKNEEEFFVKGNFDGFYTYFASTGFTFGSTPENWDTLQSIAKRDKKIFIPCVGPGYCDTRIRPWNAQNTRERDNGNYYDRMFSAAIKKKPQFIAITSFNEWHEGTQIEPAIPKVIKDFTYKDYLPLEPDYYLKRTLYWSGIFRAH